MANYALTTNPTQGVRHLTTNGSNWLWAVFAIFLFSFLIHAALSLVKKPSSHGPHTTLSYLPYLFTIGLLAGTLAYFAQASGLGSYAIRTSSGRLAQYSSYQVFWPKYAYWAVSFPIVVLALGLLTHSTWPKILFGMGLAWAWVLSYYLSSQTATAYKWGFYAIGTAAWLGLAALTFSMMHKRKSSPDHNTGTSGAIGTSVPATTPVANDHHNTTHSTGAGGGNKSAAGLIGWTNLLWLMYPIAYGVSDGGNRIGVTSSFIFFGILDLLLLPLVAAASLFHARRFGVPARGYDSEKGHLLNGHAGHRGHSIGSAGETTAPAATTSVVGQNY